MLRMGLWRRFGEFFFCSCCFCFWNGNELGNDRITALEQLSQLPGAPSVGMHDVPRQSVGEHLGFGKDDDLGRDELDDRLARKLLFILFSSFTDTKTHYLQNTRGIYTPSKTTPPPLPPPHQPNQTQTHGTLIQIPTPSIENDASPSLRSE